MSLTPAQHAELDRQITIERLEDAAAYRAQVALKFLAHGDTTAFDYDAPAGPGNVAGRVAYFMTDATGARRSVWMSR